MMPEHIARDIDDDFVFRCKVLKEKLLILIQFSLKNLRKGWNWQYMINAPDNDLVPYMQRAITWTKIETQLRH